MELHLFGAATPSGEAFRHCAALAQPSWPLYAYSRCSAAHPADFRDPAAFRPAGEMGAQAIWISFGPIWLFAPFLEQLACSYPERVAGLRGIIVCSSSSVITKRYSVNAFDRQLVACLTSAEEQLLSTCRRLQIPSRILQPTLIYGQVGPYRDRNLSRLLQLLRRLPLLPLPASTGLRQPIHARQLAAVAFRIAQHLIHSNWDPALPERIPLGGDVLLTYRAMLQALQHAQPFNDPARRCRFLPIPSRLFNLMAAPLMLPSPKGFEAVMRMGSDLAGFIPSHQLLAEPPQPFPLPDSP